jgi:hypothetical protein
LATLFGRAGTDRLQEHEEAPGPESAGDTLGDVPVGLLVEVVGEERKA